MENKEYHSYRRSIFWPLFFILAGVLLLLGNLNLLGGINWDTILRLWPLLLIVGGIDSIYRRSHFVGPMVLMGIGTMLLLNNLGYLNLSWQLFFSLWPVLLIAAGLDIIIGRHSTWGAVLGVTLGIVLIAAVAWLMLSMPTISQANQFESFSQTLNGADKASVELNNVVGSMQVSSGAASGHLIDANLRQISNEKITANEYLVQNGHGFYAIKAHGIEMYPASAVSATRPDWDVKLTSSVPLSLDSHLLTGQQNIDLSELQIDDLNTETVIGKTEVTLPKSGFKRGRINMLAGQVVINVPRGVNVRIITDTLLVPLNLPVGFERNGKEITSLTPDSRQPMELEVQNIIGAITVQYK